METLHLILLQFYFKLKSLTCVQGAKHLGCFSRHISKETDWKRNSWHSNLHVPGGSLTCYATALAPQHFKEDGACTYFGIKGQGRSGIKSSLHTEGWLHVKAYRCTVKQHIMMFLSTMDCVCSSTSCKSVTELKKPCPFVMSQPPSCPSVTCKQCVQ